MFDTIKAKIRFNQYNKALGEPLNPISSLAILTIAHIDPMMNTYEADLTNASFVTSIDTVAFLAFLSNITISHASIGREKEKWFAKYYLDYLSKLTAFILSVPIATAANYILNRLMYFEDVFISSRSLDALVNEYANLLHRDSLLKKFVPIKNKVQLSFNAIEHIEYYIAATSLLPFFDTAIKPSASDVINFLQLL